MPHDPDLNPMTPEELRRDLAFALTFDGRKRFRRADNLLADIAARHIVDHLERCGMVVMRRRDEQWGNTSDVGKGGNASS
jgi:hypothetical protein